jgi:hypothetical protein
VSLAESGAEPGAVSGQLFRPAAADETILQPTKPFPAVGADIRKHRLVNHLPTKTADGVGMTGESEMRTLGFILALAFVLAVPSMAGPSDAGLPGIGTFTYNGSPIAASVTRSIVVAAR